MAEDRQEIVRLNITRYERPLATETDQTKLATIRNLLGEARGRAGLLIDEAALAQTGKEMTDLLHDVMRLRARAEGYRSMADAASDATRVAYLHLAQSYEALAKRAEGGPANQGTRQNPRRCRAD
jgi:hypothetical protein